MTFEISRGSHKPIDFPGVKKKSNDRYEYKYLIEINSLEDLQKIEEYYEENLIISMRYKSITIYDCYME